MPIILLSLLLMKHWNLTLWKYMIINYYFMIKSDYNIFKDLTSAGEI